MDPVRKPTQRIKERILELLELHKGGLRYTDLRDMIHKSDPDLDFGTIETQIWHVQEDSRVDHQKGGLYRLSKYKSWIPDNEKHELTELPSSIDSPSLACWLEENERRVASLNIRELARRAAMATPIPRKVKSSESTLYIRDPHVAAYAKKLAAGKCDLCANPAPFLTLNAESYLESHHVKWLSRGGHDLIDNVVALCPNCHRKMHVRDEIVDRDQLILRIAERDSWLI